jgi:GT2 family glycosyltransferase
MDSEKIMSVKIICPYIYKEEADILKENLGWEIDYIFEEDIGRIGSDLMYQKLWKQCPDDDIVILHSDMESINENWLTDLLTYVNKYPEVGMFGCKLLYPIVTDDNKRYIQCAGGRFKDGVPDHFGSGVNIFTGQRFKELEIDEGQYNKVREVAWTTFGGVYIRRQLLEDVGNFDPSFEWTYNRDVDYCLSAREKGWKIYQTPVELLHFEAKDNKRMRSNNAELNAKEQRNLERLKEKWADTEYYKTIEIDI